MPPKKSASAGENQCPLLKLAIEKGPSSGQTNEYKPGSVIRIGRVVRGNTLAIKDAGISTKHLVIQVESGSDLWTITDIGSSNGTILNGEQLEPSDSVKILDGDVIKIGELTSMRVTFEVNGAERESNGGNTRRNPRRGARNCGGELKVIDEDSELGLGVENGNNLGVGDRNDGNGGLGNEAPRFGTGDEEKVTGRRTRGLNVRDLENGSEKVEGKLRSTRNSKKEKNSKVLSSKLDDEEENSENVGGFEEKKVMKVSVRRTRGSKKDVTLSKTADEDLGRSVVEVEQRASVRSTRNSRKEQVFLDLSVIEGKRKKKPVTEKTNASEETPLEEEKMEELNIEPEIEVKMPSVVVDTESTEERVNNEGEGAAGSAGTTSGVKEGTVEMKGKMLKDLKTMTLGEWLDFLEVYLPMQIIDITEEMISEMKEKARRLHEYKLQQNNAKDKGKVAMD